MSLKVNEFRFENGGRGLATYITAITPERRNAIKNISIYFSHACERAARIHTLHEDELVLLSECTGLQKLKLLLPVPHVEIMHYPWAFDFPLPGVQHPLELLGSMHRLLYFPCGLTFDLTALDYVGLGDSNTDDNLGAHLEPNSLDDHFDFEGFDPDDLDDYLQW